MRNQILCLALFAFGATMLFSCAPTAKPRPSGYELVRAAAPADLRVILSAVRPGPDGYPEVTALVQNIKDIALVVPYGPSSMIVYAGPYVQTGAEGSFALRHQLLQPQEFMTLDVPQGPWRKAAEDGRPELIMPVKMPAGRYVVWVTFRVSLQNNTVLESDHTIYETSE